MNPSSTVAERANQVHFAARWHIGEAQVCDGSQISQADYPLLFGAIGTAFGGSGAPYFNLPDLRGMFLRGVDGGALHDPDSGTRTSQSGGGIVGDVVGSVQVDAVANHQHNWDHFFYNFNFRGSDIACHQPADSGNLQTNTKQATNNDGGVKTGSLGAETRPKNVYVYYLVYGGPPPSSVATS